MTRVFTLIFFLLLIPLNYNFAFGTVENFSTDKLLYHMDDQLNISGNIAYDPDVPFITIQIFTPGKSVFADFKTFPVNPNGSFSTSFHVGGPTWASDGDYLIKVTYAGNLEKSIEYKEFSDISPSSNPDPDVTPVTPNPDPDVTPVTPNPELESMVVLEPVSSFSTLKFKVSNFPALENSPQYYIDRYNNEPDYKRWFDSQFPNDSIYNILGYEDPVSVPDWIRNSAEWWAIGEITDSDFVSGIEFMLENNIIMVSNISSSGNTSTEEIPDWIRNSAHWWSQDLISEDEFVNSLKFLIQKGVIVIN